MNRFESYFVVALVIVALAAIGWFSGLIPFILNGLYFLLPDRPLYRVLAFRSGDYRRGQPVYPQEITFVI